MFWCRQSARLGLAATCAARKLRYFYSNTLIAWQTLAFHGDPWRMLRGVVLLSVLKLVLYGILAALAVKGTPVDPLPRALIVVGILLICLIHFALPAPSFTAQLQNLVWMGTHSRALDFASPLHFRSLAWLTLKNWLFTVLALNLYRLFAVLATTRTRLDAMRLSAG